MSSTPFQIAKIDEAECLVFGFANVSISKGDTLLVDTQGDQIAPKELEKAAYEYVLTAREADEMHKGDAVGHLVESMMFTDEKLKALATDPSTGSVDQEGYSVLKRLIPPRWWVGYQLTPSAFAKVKDGTYKMFSIAGSAQAEQV